MSYAEKLFKGSAIVFVAAAAAAIIGYLLRLFIARNLSVADFGLLYSILAFVGLFSIFKDLGLGTTLAKFLAEFKAKEQNDNIKPSIALAGLLQMAAALALMLPIIYFSDLIAVSYFRTIAASFPLKLIAVSFMIGTFMTTLQQAAQGLGHVKIYSLTEPVRITSTFLLVFVFIYMGVAGVGYAYIFAAVAAVVFLLSSLKIQNTVRGRLFFGRVLAGKILRFGFPVFIGGLSSLLLVYTDTITLTFFKGVEAVGLYQAALPTSQLLWVMVSSLAVLLLPVVSEMWAKKQKEYISTAIGLIAKFAFIIVIPLTIIMIAFAEDIIRILFGPAYLPAAIALQILAINAVFYTLFVIFSTSLISMDKPLMNTKITAFISVINLVLNIMLVPYYGIAAAAFTTTLSYFIGAILAYYSLRRTITIRLDITSLAKILLGGVLTLAVVFAAKTILAYEAWIEIVVSLALGLVFYTIFILKSKSLRKEELKFLSRLNMPIPKAVEKIVMKLAS